MSFSPLFAALLLLSTIFSFCNGDGYEEPFGCSSTAIPDSDRGSALDSMNYMRQDVAKGDIFDGDQNTLPATKNMYKLLWSCSLEDQAETLAKQCSSSAPSVQAGQGYNYALGPNFNVEAQASLWTSQIFTNTWANPSDGNANVKEYSNIIQAKTTQVGCSQATCSGNTAVMCIFNQPNVAAGTQIYEEGTACTADADCTTYPDATCEDGLCVLPVPASTGTTATGTPTTVAATITTTTPRSTTNANPRPELNQWCPANADMLDRIRTIALDAHNYRRSRLAQGLVPKDNGNLLPAAANMIKLKYDCDLEKTAAEQAKQCQGRELNPTSQGGTQQNANWMPLTTSVPYRTNAMRESVKTWWRQVKLVPGIGMAVTFKAHHLQSSIRWFTRMAWATTQRLGCGVIKCGYNFSIVCLYQPGGNIVGNVVYVKGTRCNCPAGYSCSVSEQLCVANT